MPSTYFGPHAQDYADRLPPQLELLVYDEVGFGEALTAALDRAYHRGPFLCAPVIGDRRSHVAFEAACDIVTAQGTYPQRRAALDLVRDERYEFGGKTQCEHAALTKKERDSLGDVMLVADGVVVRSWAEFARLGELLGVRPHRSYRAVAQPPVPIPAFAPRRGAKTIVVWAPQLDPSRASLFALALEELKAPVVIACRDAATGTTLGLRAHFIEATDAKLLAQLARECAAIIDGAPDDPASAVALARLGLPLAAAYPSGAYEYVDGLYLYEPWDYRSILHAALAALGGEAPISRPNLPTPDALVAEPPRLGPPIVENPPLVSIVIATLDRHGILPRALDSIARQTYPNIEVVIVNDGGAPVDALVAGLDRVVVVNNDSPRGAIAASNDAFAYASGDYFYYSSDDDVLLPTHVSRLVYALERTGGAVAAGMCADSYLEAGDGPYYDLIGTAVRPYRATDPTILRTVPHSMPVTLVRRDVQFQLGEWNPQAPVYNDYERVLRFIEYHDILWVSHVVFNMDTRLDRSNASGNLSGVDRATDLRNVWSRHPVAERPDIAQARESLLERYRQNEPPTRLPLHRGVTRLHNPRKSVYRLHTATR